MKIRHKGSGGKEKIELQMTPMIDIVFQLLVFFILTFNVVAQEGDFNIRMPAMGAPAESIEQPELTTLRVRMEAIKEGEQAGELGKLKLDNSVIFNGGDLAEAFRQLHRKILQKVKDAGGPDEASKVMEVEFECDYNLKYNNVIDAITAVTGSKARDSDQVKRLIEKIKFAPPKKPSS